MFARPLHGLRERRRKEVKTTVQTPTVSIQTVTEKDKKTGDAKGTYRPPPPPPPQAPLIHSRESPPKNQESPDRPSPSPRSTKQISTPHNKHASQQPLRPPPARLRCDFFFLPCCPLGPGMRVELGQAPLASDVPDLFIFFFGFILDALFPFFFNGNVYANKTMSSITRDRLVCI